jgi:hypothetical protein
MLAIHQNRPIYISIYLFIYIRRGVFIYVHIFPYVISQVFFYLCILWLVSPRIWIDTSDSYASYLGAVRVSECPNSWIPCEIADR